MRLEQFFEKFELFADAPNAVAKMRELVLELAIRGRLFLSEGFDPPALSESSVSFPIPHNWKWTVLNEAADCRAASKVDPSSINDSDWVLDLEDIDGDGGKIIATATFAERCSLSTKASFASGDVLYGKLRPYLNKVVIADRPGFCTTEIIPLRPRQFLSAGYLRLFLRSPYFLRYAAAKNYGMKMPRLGTKDLESAEIPLPPLAEQKRIVAKVDELMAVCDRLETQQQERDTRHAALARASLTRFAEAPTPANLDFLFHQSFPITPADLRKAILSLAVQGKLVSQDMDDESGQELLEKIDAERTRGIKARRVNAMKPVPAVDSDELTYDVPSNWGVARLSQLVMELQTGPFGSSLHKSDYQRGGTPVINPASIRDGRIEAIEEMAIGKDTLKRLAGFKLIAGDIIMARRGEMGRCAVVTDKEESWLCGTGSLVLRMPKSLHGLFLAMLIGAPQAREYLGEASVGTTMQNLNQSILAKMPIGVPPLAEQRRIVAKVDQLLALVDQLETQLATSRAAAEKLMEAVVAELTGQQLEIAA